jgi:hypothetical protein
LISHRGWERQSHGWVITYHDSSWATLLWLIRS